VPPGERVVHDLSSEEKICPCGCEMQYIGEDQSEKIEYIPASMLDSCPLTLWVSMDADTRFWLYIDRIYLESEGEESPNTLRGYI